MECRVLLNQENMSSTAQRSFAGASTSGERIQHLIAGIRGGFDQPLDNFDRLLRGVQTVVPHERKRKSAEHFRVAEIIENILAGLSRVDDVLECRTPAPVAHAWRRIGLRPREDAGVREVKFMLA